MDRAFVRRSMANALLLFANTASSLSSSSSPPRVPVQNMECLEVVKKHMKMVEKN